MAVVRCSGWQLQARRIFRTQRVMLPMLAAFLMVASSSARSQVSCTGLCLKQVSCAPGVTTSITGTVYAPNGTDPLPNVLVYIPNAPVGAFTSGVQCQPNGQPALGSPLVSTTTATNGTFTLTNVPAGTNIPLVIQAGKWRRQLVVPTVSQCTSNTPPNPAGDVFFRLPKNQSEGDIPKIAIVTGRLDAVECVLNKMGVASSEFTNPSGSGRINLYSGDEGPGARIDVSTPSEAVLESSQTTLNQYDLVMLPCQGTQDTSIPTSYLTNVGNYANAGGRIYATHYSYDLLYTNPAFAGAVDWKLTTTQISSATGIINTAIPEGRDLAAWLQLVDPGSTYGQIPVNTLRDDVSGFPVGSATQSFLSITSPAESIQFTFPTPVAAASSAQCGRVLFNQYHVENQSEANDTFPTECTAGITTPQEQLLEYTLFDLGTFTSATPSPTVSVGFTNTPATLTQGDSADTVAITVNNTSTTTATNATLTLALTLPSGLTATAIAPAIPASSGWTCTLGTLTCTRTTGLDASASDAIVVTFNVGANAASPQTINATVSNGNLVAPVTAADALVIPLTLSPPAEPLLNASYNVAYSQQFTAGGGAAPYSYSVSGTLPPGLSLNTATGLLSGTPTVAADGNTYTFNIIVSDSGGNTVSQPYSIAVPQVLASSALTVVSAANPTPGSAVTVPAGATVTATFTLTDTAGLPIPIPAGTSILATNPSATAVYGTPGISGGTLTETISDTAAEALTLSAYKLGVPISPSTVSTTFVPPAYVVTVNTDASSGNGVAANCIDPNLPGGGDNSKCSLRDAVAAANALSGVTTNIGFSLPNPSTILIQQQGGIAISQSVNLNGPGATALTVEGGIAPYNGTTQTANNPILQIGAGNVGISGLTFANGIAGTSGTGGAINADGSGSLTVSNSTFSGNRAANGGAILAYSTLTVSNSTFSGNSAIYGGALFAPLLTVSNSTFSGNSVRSGGGAITATVNLTVSNSIFSGDSGPTGSGIYALNGGTATSIVYYGDTFNGVTPTSSINADPKLSPLGNYGGTTPTMLPLPGSAAICAGTQPSLNGAPLATDQRGVSISGSRYGQTGCYDVGAVQTGYALTLGPSPVVPSLVTVGSAISPAPVASVTENGTPLAAGPATVNMTDADSDLSNAATVSVATSTSNGQASFSNLLFTGAEASDTLTATLPLNANVSPALSLTASSNSFQVGQLPQSITNFNPPANATYGDASITLSATGGASGNPVTFKVINGGPGLISGNQLTITGAGTIKVEADQAGNTVYSAANPVTANIVVAPASSTTTVTCSPTSVPYTGGAQTPCTASVTGVGGLSVNLTSSLVYSSNVHVGVNTASATATYGGDNNHNGSTNTASFTITQATPVVTWANPPSIVYGTGTGAAQKTATATGVGGVSLPGSYFYTTPDGTVFGVGTHPLGVAFTPTDSTDYVPVSAFAYLTVTKATPTVTWAAPAAITYGTALSGAQLNAMSPVPGTFVYTPAAGAVLHAGSQTLSVTFTPNDTADYNPVTTTVLLTVNKATPVITWPTPASITYGTPLSATQLDATANVAGTFLYTASTGPNPLGVLLPPGTTALSATLTPTDTVDYNPVTAYVVFTVSKAQTTTTLAVTTTQTVTGTTATLIATVRPQIGGVPTGTVTYYVGSTVLGSAAVGTAFTTAVLPVGTDQITAVYGGDANFVGSSSSASAVVSVAPTTGQLTSPLSRVFYPGSAVSFTVNVPLKNFQLISGTVTLYDGNTVIGTYSLPAGGILVGITPQLSVGTHSLRAVYGGNGQYPPGQSPVVTVTVSAL